MKRTMETLDFDKVEFVHDIKQVNLLVEYLYNTKNADFDMGMAFCNSNRMVICSDLFGIILGNKIKKGDERGSVEE
jgi:hypothetical protein